MTKTMIAAVIAAVVFLPAPEASAKPDCKHAGACEPAPFNGQLQDTWDTFPYGGNGSMQCTPGVSGSCQRIATDPNGR